MAEQVGSVPSLDKGSLAQWGKVVSVISATQFTITPLWGFGDTFFVGYSVFVVRKNDSTVTAPHNELGLISAYLSNTARITHAAFTVSLAVGDEVLLLHPSIAATINLGGLAPVAAAVTANWNAAEQDLVTIGAAGVRYKLHNLTVGIQNLIGNITIRMYTLVNGVQRQIYPVPLITTFNVATDPPGICVINSTLGISNAVRVTVQSDNAADNGLAVDYDYMLEAM
jgi:hypothetical protein